MPSTQRDIEVALSGGGTRAAAFGLGALLYLFEAGKAASLRQISSVSGGSITNAFIANAFTSTPDLEADGLRVLGQRLTHGGLALEQLGQRVGKLLASIGCLIVVGLAASVVVLAWPGIDPLWALAPLAFAVFFGTYLVAAMRMTKTMLWVALTKWIQYATTPIEPPSTSFGSPWRMMLMLLAPTNERLESFARRPALGHVVRELGDVRSPVTHVVTATDLKHGEHLHLASDWMASSTFGLTDPGDIRLDEAVAASAAFPGGLPATRIAHKRLSLPRAATLGESHLVLVDGGVRDNLGHAFESYVATNSGEIGSVLAPITDTTFVVVVDASAPRGVADLSQNILSKIPLLRGFDQITNFPRVVGVMNQSNSEARSLALAATLQSTGLGVTVSIKQSPLDVCAAVLDDPRGVIGMEAGGGFPVADVSSQERRDRATAASAAIRGLSGFSEGRWNGLVTRNAETATTLDSLGIERVAELVMHGYVSTMCCAHIEKDWPLLPDSSWGPARFEAWVTPAS